MDEVKAAAEIATVRLSCGRLYLDVCGFVVAMQGDRCRDGDLPEHILPPIPADELASAHIGGKPAAGLPIQVVRFFRGDNWTGEMLEYVAKEINRKASPPRDLFDAVCEKLENLIPATASLVDFAKEKGVFLMRHADEQLNECRDVLARVAAWRKEVGG